MNIQHALLYDPRGHLGTLLARGPWGDAGLTPTDLKLKKLLRKLPSLRCLIVMVLNEVPHGFISITEVKNEGFIWSSLSERWVTHPTNTM